MNYYVDENGVNLGEHGVWPITAVAVLPPELVGKAIKMLDSTDVAGNPIKVPALDGDAQAALDAANEKKELLTTAYNNMVKEIYDKVEELFGTRSNDSASADLQLLKDMSTSPEIFAAHGLKARVETRDALNNLLFTKDQALDTGEKISTYALRRLEIIKEYSLWRAKRLIAFTDYKKQIEGA